MAPKPLHWIFRPGSERITGTGELIRQPGYVVPLIPADLLPSWVEIVGIPRRLAQERAEGVKVLGTFHKEDEGYQLKFLQDDEAEQSPAQVDDDADTDVSTLYAASEPSDTSTKPKDQPATPEAPLPATPHHHRPSRPTRGLAASRHNPLNAPPSPSPCPSPSISSPSTASQETAPVVTVTSFSKAALAKAEPKRYCRHWCHHGTCKWGISCRFQHKMPTTEAELCSVGLPDFPPWWIAANQMAIKAQVAGSKKKQHQHQKQQKQQHAGDEMFMISGGGVVALKSGKKKKTPQQQMKNQQYQQQQYQQQQHHQRLKPGKTSTTMLRMLLKAQEKNGAQSGVDDADDEREVRKRKQEESLIDV